MFPAISQLVTKREGDFEIVVYRANLELAGERERARGPARVVALQVAPNRLPAHARFTEVVYALPEKLGLGAGLRIETSQNKSGNVIAQPFPLERERRRRGRGGIRSYRRRRRTGRPGDRWSRLAR